MIVTKHAKKRIHERLNINKKGSKKLAQKAIKKGISHSEATGQLKKYMDKLFLSHRSACNLRVYNQATFIFDRKFFLITVIPLPKDLNKIVAKINERKKNHEI